ncbi:MAG TPA: hypothetical protein PLQ34_09755 [Ferrovaceae bacterium]|nr:hypothetical protein [Ferrovaceae bacterium]
MAFPKGHEKVGGRKPGSQNKKTEALREAISRLLDNNQDKMAKWLETVAEGKKGKITNKAGEIEEVYLIPPNPAKAFEMVQSLIEYQLPKLARQEITGDPDAPLKVQQNVTVFGELLKAIKMERQSEE